MMTEVTKVATSVIDAMRQQPMVLALIVVNLIFLGALMWVLSSVAETNQREHELQNKVFDELRESLAVCRELLKK